MAASFSVPSFESLSRWFATTERGRALVEVFEGIKTDIEALQTTAGALDWKDSVRAATTSALAANTRTGNVLTADAAGALGTIDGVTLAENDRVLVKNESTGANNGIYTVTSLGGGSDPWILSRSSDADTSAEVTSSMLVPVEAGTTNADKIFELDVEPPITLNTTALVFVDWRGLAITAPANVTKAAAVVGTSTTLARSDHKHDITTAAAVSVALANAEGSATSLARSDHTHNSGIQRGQVTLTAGTVTVNTGVTVTANTRVIPILVTPGAGASGTRYAVTGYSVGGPGVGAFTITAKDSAAGNNTVNTDVSVLDWVAVEGAGV